jgi:hypothetical protein
MAKYASETKVSPERSMTDIQKALRRYGATKFGIVDLGTAIQLGFEMQGRRFRFSVSLPETTEFERKRVNQFATRPMTPGEMEAARDQAIAQRWRALLLVITAKMEAVESGIETLEQAFMAQLVLPSGQTMSEWATPQIAQLYQTGSMPPMLTSGN